MSHMIEGNTSHRRSHRDPVTYIPNHAKGDVNHSDRTWNDIIVQ
jgi:hypothetical protein